MPIKAILACLTTEAAAERIMPAACGIARRFSGHLIGIHTLQAIVPYPGIALHIDHPYFKDFNDRVIEQNARISKIFEAHTADQRFVAEWRTMPAESPRASDQLVRAALYADLVITSRPDREDERPDQHGVQADLIIDTGRPILIVPPAKPEATLGSRILLAWNGTRESSAAAHSALPLLIGAEEVVVLTVSSSLRHSVASSNAGIEMSAQLARHSVKAVSHHVGQTEPSVGAQILSEAKTCSCDLIVMGGFGHSRLHSLIFGDATQFMLSEGDLPVLYSS